ncbi:hypothetical protein BVRB_2g041990 [Beta vulgaris subsp. vulgaris]|nr:hypothetical protein BVRB_2g041990 [Beta vulgaris subsp. vulgaris]
MLPEATSIWSWWWSTSNKTDETLRNVLTTLIPLFFTCWFIFYVKKQDRKQPPSPPGPRGLPLVGYLPFLGSNLHHSFKKLANLYGPIFKLRLGTKDCIVITSPSLVKEVVRDQDVVFANRVSIIAANSLLFGTLDIAFSNYGVEWRKMRKIFATEMMSNSRLDASYHLRKKQVKKMIDDTYKKAGQIIDVGELAFSTIGSSVMRMIWGDTLIGGESSVIDSEFRAVVNKQLELLGTPNISDFFPLLARFDLQGIEHRMKIISRRNEEILDKAINRHSIAKNVQCRDFLGYLLQLTKSEDRTRSLTLPQVKAMLMDAMTERTSMLVLASLLHAFQWKLPNETVDVDLLERFGIVMKKSKPLFAVPSPRLSNLELYSYAD